MNTPKDLRPGDVLLYAPSDLLGVAIAIKCWTWLSHVECCIGNGQVIAARIQGVDIYRERIDEYLVCVRRPFKQFNLVGAIAAVKPMMFQKYEVSGLFEFFAPLRHKAHATRICSSVATVFLRGGGVEPFNPNVAPEDVAPAQLYQTAELNTVWTR